MSKSPSLIERDMDRALDIIDTIEERKGGRKAAWHHLRLIQGKNSAFLGDAEFDNEFAQMWSDAAEFFGGVQ